jgi:hypothetical protein
MKNQLKTKASSIVRLIIKMDISRKNTLDIAIKIFTQALLICQKLKI